MIQKITQDHIDAVKASGLPQSPVIAMGFVSYTQMSIARHFGGMKYQGKQYIYLPEADQLVRDDVLKWLNKESQKKPANNDNQETLKFFKDQTE